MQIAFVIAVVKHCGGDLWREVLAALKQIEAGKAVGDVPASSRLLYVWSKVRQRVA